MPSYKFSWLSSGLSLLVCHRVFSLFQYIELEKHVCKGVHIIGKENCLSMHIKEDRFSVNKFSEIILAAVKNSNDSVRQAKISFHNPLSAQEMPMIGKLLDDFLTSRLWWNVAMEPYSWSTNTNSTKEGIILQKSSALAEPYLKLISSIQYPDNETCDKVPMVLYRAGAVHPGWGSMVEFQYIVRSTLPYFVAANYVSKSNSPSAANEYTAWIAPHECNTTINKWDCAFLSSTSCNIPDVITQCRSKNCVSNYPDSFNGALLLSVSNSSGIVVPNEEAIKLYHEADEEHKYWTPNNNLQLKYSKHNTVPAFIQLPPYNKKFTMSRGLPDSTYVTYVFHYILRSNYQFRSLIAKLIHDFYFKNEVNHSTRCVAAQVRRGDRTIKGVDMIALCKNKTTPITDKNPVNYCMNDEGQLQNCDDGIGEDKGCESEVPFGAITLDMVIRAAENLASPEVNTLIVFTDDEAWLESEKIRVKSKYPDWKIVNLEAPKAGNGSTDNPFGGRGFANDYNTMRFGGGSQSGAYFLGSMKLAQQCEAFIGHFHSSVPALFWSSMCIKNANGRYQGFCPPVYDLGTGVV